MPVNPPLNAFLASANVFCRLKRATTVLLLCASTSVLATAQQSVGGSRSAQARIAARIDQGSLIKLTGNVRVDLTPNKDLGAVEGSKPLRLALILKRTDAQQADLDSLIAQQQTPGSPNFHKWLTPQQFGERFGAAASDIAKINQWLQSQGFEVKSVLNNGTMIDFAATAGGVRNTFKTELHYYNFPDGKEMANTTAPQVPAALGNVVANISGLAPMHARAPHEVRNVSYNAQTRKWNNSPAPATSLAVTPKPAFDGPVGGGGNYNVTPQDEYTIFDVNPTFSAGNLGQTATVGVAEPFDMAYGTVNPTTGQASGGLVNTFRTLFGVPGTLNMVVMHGAGTVTCNDPGTSTGGNDGEMSLDAEWANALAPSAKLLYMSCDTGGAFGNGGIQAIAALIDNSLSDTITVSYDFNESPTQNYAAIDQLYQQAATQGQSIFISSGDAGDDNGGFTGTPSLARDGLIIGFLAASPLVTAAGGTDFQDQ